MDNSQAYSLSEQYLTLQEQDFSLQDVHTLGELIVFHSELYYEKQESIISDSEYDLLFKKLQFLEGQFELKDKVTQRVGSTGKQSSFQKVAHSRPMISLDNTYNAQELRDFDERIHRILTKQGRDTCNIPYTIEFKFDGLGVELVYEEGIFTRAITRGNGVEGEDVTENVRQIAGIPKKIQKKGKFEVRGEVVMPFSSFEKLNNQAKEKGEKVFSNPRNAASGSLRILDTSVTKKRDLVYFAYDVSDQSIFIDNPSSSTPLQTLPFEKRENAHENLPLDIRGVPEGNEGEGFAYSRMIDHLGELGFMLSSYFPKCQGIDEVISQIENFGELRKTLDFEIDGLVVKVNDMALWKDIGSTEHHPRYAIAYKFPAEIVTTEILSIEHSIGRTGTITPVANLEPVNIGGAMIQRSTLHNYEEVEKLGVGEGDIVFLKRAGEVIPKIISVSVKALTPNTSPSGEGRIVRPPELCPSCNTRVLKDEDKVRYYCPNMQSCPRQLEERFAHFVSKHGLNIDGFGTRQVALFLERGFLKNFGDVFRLHEKRTEILELEGFQERSVNKLLDSIESVRQIDIVIFIKSLGIPAVGKKVAKTLGSIIFSYEILENIKNMDTQELTQLPDIGEEVARSFIEYFSKNEDEIHDLLDQLTITYATEKGETHDGKYSGKKMCITGSFDGYSRDDLVELLEKQGGEFVGSVSKKTDYLLAGEKAGSKLKKAQDLGVEVLSLEDFLQ